MLREILGAERVSPVEALLLGVLAGHIRRNGEEQGRRRAGEPGGGRKGTVDFHRGSLLERAVLGRLRGQRKAEDDGIALLLGGKVGDRRGDLRFARDGFAGRGAAGEKKEKWKRENRKWRRVRSDLA